MLNSIMQTLSKLKRDFTACLPVIAPHADIEAELLLAGIKPIGFFVEIKPEHASDPQQAKRAIDIAKLDDSVLLGHLKKTSIKNHHGMIIHYYCQPESEDRMHILAAEMLRTNDPQEKDKTLRVDLGAELGYRLRDRLLWKAIHSSNLVNWFNERVHSNLDAKDAYQSKMLEKAGIPDADQYFDDINALAEEILDNAPN